MEFRKKRKPIVALLANLLVVGLGQIYNGKIIQGIVLNLIMIGGASLAFVVTPRVTHNPTNVMASFVVGLLLLAVIQGYAVIEAYNDSKTKTEYILKSYNKWYIYLFYAIVSIVIFGILRDEFPLKSYKTPAKSMEPTIIADDHFYIDKTAYSKSNPMRGDIIVFEFQEDTSKDFIKRIVGTPGDSIEIVNKKLILNGKEQKEAYVQFVDSETLRQRDNMSKITVPTDKYFVMGDNRDRSYDSRFFGFIERDKIRGKAIFIYYSRQLSRALTEIK